VAYLLHIESSSTVCSVCISKDTDVLALKELNSGYTHAENLHVFIQDILEEASLKPNQLNAISVSSGPGSYTGLRIGFSAAKGLAYALQIPLIIIDTLQALTSLVLNPANPQVLYCPMIDARRMEVYLGMYDSSLETIIPVKAFILDEHSIQSLSQKHLTYFFGDGMPKAKALLETLPNVQFIDGIVPSSTALVQLAYQKYIHQEFADVAYAEPFYLKDFFFATSKK
jgi:tRNA threonylcarbamoyladenosine biosynthesis protein TsaB